MVKWLLMSHMKTSEESQKESNTFSFEKTLYAIGYPISIKVLIMAVCLWLISTSECVMSLRRAMLRLQDAGGRTAARHTMIHLSYNVITNISVHSYQ